MVVPQSLADAQALLDFFSNINTGHSYAHNFSDDNYYFKESYFNSLNANLQNMHTWQKDVVLDADWAKYYRTILTANLALETLAKNDSTTSNQSQWNTVKGMAHFIRGYSFFHLLQFYAEPYKPGSQALGIPLRLATNINIPSTRASLQQCWQQVVDDYSLAATYLPSTALLPNRPSKAAAYLALAISHLHMQNFELAAAAANSSVQLNGTLMNYNTLNANAPNPFQQFNSEVLFHAHALGVAGLSAANHVIDSTLFRSYHPNDLRRVLFFRSNGTGTVGFRGSYNGNTTQTTLFVGLTTPEAYLVRAEANARLGLFDSALNDINRLLITRFKTGTFVPLSLASTNNVLDTVLAERRKEMVFRGSRWYDLRRLNQEPALQKTLVRKFANLEYTLLPGTSRYTFYIPQDVINVSGISQNER